MTAAPPLLVVQGLTRVFGEGATEVRALSDVELRSDRHELTLVMGPSGSGKTTLLTMLGCLLRPTSGSIAIDGLEMTGLPPREQTRVRRMLVGFVFQTFNLLESLTAQENVEVALNVAGLKGPAATRRAGELLAAAGLARRAAFLARGLSAGERQRVALARALANRPALILADEPTANLDTRNGREVMALLRGLTDESPVGAVVVSHDERLADLADRIVRLEDGRVVDRVEPSAGEAWKPEREDARPAGSAGLADLQGAGVAFVHLTGKAFGWVLPAVSSVRVLPTRDPCSEHHRVCRCGA